MNVRHEAIKLRQAGKSYLEIQGLLGQHIPKSTLSYWCREILLPSEYFETKKQKQRVHLQTIRQLAQQTKAAQRQRYFAQLKKNNRPLLSLLKNKKVAKLILAMLYAAEGSKPNVQGRCILVFGNSDPALITFFIKLLRHCYNIDETKFRCTVQCRADQDVDSLKRFWSKTASIPLSQFYKTQVDPRTKGKPTTKLDYRGVCRVEYLSAEVFWDIIVTAETMMGH